MVLKVKLLTAVHGSRYLERLESVLPSRYGLKRVRLHRYYRAHELLAYFPNPLRFVQDSKKVHGILVNDELYVHPVSLARYLGGRFAKVLDAHILDLSSKRRFVIN